MKHWQLSNEANGIVVAVFDKAGESANSLSAEVMAEFGDILDQLDKQPPKGLIVRSGKEAGFIAGADIEEFSQLDSAEKGRALVTRGWNLFNRLAAVPYPTLALVRGHCLGGGLELALACRYLVAVGQLCAQLDRHVVPDWLVWLVLHVVPAVRQAVAGHGHHGTQGNRRAAQQACA